MVDLGRGTTRFAGQVGGPSGMVLMTAARKINAPGLRPSGRKEKGRSWWDRPLGVVAWACLPGVADADGDGGGLVVALPLQAAVEEAGQVVAVGEDICLAPYLAGHAGGL